MLTSCSSGIWPNFKSSVEAQEKFFKMLEEQGYTEFEDKSRALADIIRQVEEIYVRDFKKIREERLKDPEYRKRHFAPEPKPAPKKLHWAPVSNLYQKIVNHIHREKGR